jgi:predicted dehydrogenase
MITRRQFVQGSTATLIAMNAPAALARVKRQDSANETIRMAVIGIRGRGGNHIDAFRKLPNVKVVAICDVDEDVLAQKKAQFEQRGEKVDTYTDMRHVFDRDDIDAISTATPNHWHALCTIWACQAGKDVYVEKPVSHNIWEGRQIVKAAERYGRIVGTGTQSRSSTAIQEAYKWLHEGGLGDIKLARGLCYKPRRSIGKVDGPQKVSDAINYDLWTGPADLVPLHRRSLHYDWHWDYNTGNGDVGNQGIHQMDLCRWALGESSLPQAVGSVGARIGYDDDGNTPNTQVVLLKYAKAPVIFEVRGLPRDKAAQAKWGSGEMDDFYGQKIGVVVHCANGTMTLSSNYGKVRAFDLEGEEVKSWSGDSNHFANFIDAVRSRKSSDLAANIEEGHLSSAMCHMGNISHVLGTPRSVGRIRASLSAKREALESVDRMIAHAGANEVDLKATPLAVGPWLTMNPATERFANDAANALLTRPYRDGFRVPTEV